MIKSSIDILRHVLTENSANTNLKSLFLESVCLFLQQAVLLSDPRLFLGQIWFTQEESLEDFIMGYSYESVM